MNAPQPSNSIPAQSPPATAALLDSVLRTADAHYQREDWAAARDSLSLAVELAPDHVPARAALGSLQYQLQEYPAACASFTIATTQSLENPDLHTQLAMVLIKLEQADEAKAALQQALNLRPHHPTARQLLGDLHFAAKRYAEAARQYGTLLELQPNAVNLLLHLGKCLYEMHDLSSAHWCFQRVVALEPPNPIASEALQILAAKTKAAVVDVPSNIRLHPSNPARDSTEFSTSGNSPATTPKQEACVRRKKQPSFTHISPKAGAHANQPA